MRIIIEAEPAEVKALIMELYPVQIFGGEYIEKMEKWTDERPDFFSEPENQASDVLP